MATRDDWENHGYEIYREETNTERRAKGKPVSVSHNYYIRANCTLINNWINNNYSRSSLSVLRE